MAQCESCTGPLPPSIRQIKYCSDACRKAGSRARNAPVVTLAPEPEDKSTVEAVTRELEAADRADSYKGRAAIALARRIDASTAVMGFAPLVAQLEKTMDAALAGVEAEDSPIVRMRDELAARRGA